MMKSFFKKLAFVMALAMVVSAMAPAATAKAADVEKLGICLQDDATWTALETDEMTVGNEARDYRFAGAPKNWKDYKWTWTSSDEKVAVVDAKSGLVAAVAPGTTTIKVASDDNAYVGELALTVKAKEVVPAYVVKQTASNKVTITWADAKAATDNVTLYKVFTLTSGEKEPVKWPCTVETKNGVATVVSFVELDDNEDYLLDINGEEYPFTAYVGKIVEINVIPKDRKSNGTEIYACAEDPYRPFRFDVEFITDGGVKLSLPTASMYYEVLEADDGVEIDSSGDYSYITVEGASATVRAIYYYTDEKGESQQLEDEFVVVGFPVPVTKFDGILDYAIVAKDTKLADVKWGKTSLINGENAYVALKIGDTQKGAYYAGELTLSTDPAKKEFAFAEAGLGDISYRSSDETKLLVGKYDGKLTAISSDGTAVVIVELTSLVGEKEVTKPVYAFEVDLEPERKAKTINAKGVTVLVSDNAIDATATITFTVVDQYNNPWTNWNKKEMKTSVKGAPDLSANITQDVKDGKLTNTGKITVNGAAFKDVVKSKASVTYTLNIANATIPVTISLKNPPIVTGTDSTIKTTGFLAEATGTDIDAKAAGTVYATIKAYETWTSNGVAYKVGNVNPEKLFVYDNKDYWTKNDDGLASGDVVVMVTKPNGDLIVPTVNASTGAITVPVATAEADKELKIEATGTYTVTLYKVTATTKNTDNITYKVNKLPVGDTTFAVNNKCTNLAISFPTGTLTSDISTTIEDVIVSLATFKKGNNTETVEAHDIVGKAGVYNDSADKYYVKSITVKNYLNNGSFFKQTIAIDKIFNVPNLPDAQ